MPAGPEPMTAARRPGRGLLLERQRRVDALVEHRPEDLVAGVAVAVADGDRLVDLVAAAVLLARGGADAAEHAGERDRALEDAHRLAPVGLGVRLEEARDVDVARALVLAGRQAVGVVVAEDQLEVGPADPAQLVGLGADHHVRLGRARAADRRLVLALDLDHAHPAGAEARQLGLVAQRGDLDAVVAADLEDRLALEALDDPPVDLDADPRRALRPLRRLRRDEPLGEGVLARRRRVVDARGVRADLPGTVERRLGTDDEVGHQRDPAAVAPAPTAIGVQTPAGQVERRRWSSSSDRKYRIALVNGRVARRSWSHSAEAAMSCARSTRRAGVGGLRACRSRCGRRSRTAGAGRSGRGWTCRRPRPPRSCVRSRARSTMQARSSAMTTEPGADVGARLAQRVELVRGVQQVRGAGGRRSGRRRGRP